MTLSGSHWPQEESGLALLPLLLLHKRHGDPGLPRPLSPPAGTRRATVLITEPAPLWPRVSCGRHLSAFLTWWLVSEEPGPLPFPKPPPLRLWDWFFPASARTSLCPSPLFLLPPVSAFHTFPFSHLVFLNLLSFTPPKELSEASPLPNLPLSSHAI